MSSAVNYVASQTYNIKPDNSGQNPILLKKGRNAFFWSLQSSNHNLDIEKHICLGEL